MAKGQSDSQNSALSKGYASLETQTRHISDKRIKKWPKSGSNERVQSRIHGVLREVERTSLVQKKHRKPGRNTTKSDKGEEETLERQQGLEDAIALIERRIPKIPFPPGTQESDFDFENVLDNSRALESQVISNTHSVNLLRSEIEKERAALAVDQEELGALEDALRRTETMRRKQAKNFHPLARAFVENDQLQTEATTDINTNASPVIDLSALLNDPQLGGLLEQLHNHLDSMDSNTAPVQGLTDAILKAQAALDVHAARSLNPIQQARLYDMRNT